MIDENTALVGERIEVDRPAEICQTESKIIGEHQESRFILRIQNEWFGKTKFHLTWQQKKK